MADGYDFHFDYEATPREVLLSPSPDRTIPDLTASPPRRGRGRGLWNPPLWRGRGLQPPSPDRLMSPSQIFTPDLTASPPRKGRGLWNPPLWKGRSLQPPSLDRPMSPPPQVGAIAATPPGWGGMHHTTWRRGC